MNEFEHQLDDGRRVLIRAVQPTDRERVKNAYLEASRSTIYRRFFNTRPALSDSELTYLTEVDQTDHVAWGAVDIGQEDEPGVGIARFVRDRADPSKAEFALAVADGWQGNGLGRTLFAVLYCLGQEQEISTLYGVCLFENRFLVEWLRELGATVRETEEYFEVELSLSDGFSQQLDSETLDRFRDQIKELKDK